MKAGKLLGIILHVTSEETGIKIKTLTESIPGAARAGQERKPGCSQMHRSTATRAEVFWGTGRGPSPLWGQHSPVAPTLSHCSQNRTSRCQAVSADPDENPALLTPTSGGKSSSFPIALSACVISRVRLFVTPWTVAHQAPLSGQFSRQELLQWVATSCSQGSS